MRLCRAGLASYALFNKCATGQPSRARGRRLVPGLGEKKKNFGHMLCRSTRRPCPMCVRALPGYAHLYPGAHAQGMVDSINKENVDPNTFATPGAPSGQTKSQVPEATPVVTTRARSRMLENDDMDAKRAVQRLLQLRTPVNIATPTASGNARTLSRLFGRARSLCNIEPDC